MLSPSLAAFALCVLPGVLATPRFFPRDNPHGPNKTWSPPATSNITQQRAGKYWPGFSGISKMFTFGDSYTTTGFNVSLAQPSPDMPLGNPPLPGYTAVNGPGWVEQLSIKYNQSLIETYNLAYGGATVDSNLVKPYEPQVLSFREQVNDWFFPYYVEDSSSSNTSSPFYSSSSTLFAAFFGINDVGNSYFESNSSAILDAIFTVYAGLLSELYTSAGARNFLLLNVPPVNLSPLTAQQGAQAQASEDGDIQDFNDRLAALATSVQYAYPDTTVFLYDTHRVFSQVLQYPASYAQTAGYKNTTDYCDAYQNGTPELDTFDPECGVPVDEYFWLNSLHPTYLMQDVMAQQMAELMEALPASS